jgi:dTDP-glucose pyrophosphorylase
MTVLAARHLIDNAEPLLIANSDQMVLPDNRAYIRHSLASGLDGVILTMPANDPKWSFVELDAAGHAVRVVEKEVISDMATVGIYHFASGAAFVRAADAMIEAGDQVNGEYYVAPVYNYLIRAGGTVGVFDAGAEGEAFWGLGTPFDLYRFLEFAPATP